MVQGVFGQAAGDAGQEVGELDARVGAGVDEVDVAGGAEEGREGVRG
ncbi:hypothetical protein AB0878_27425 [Amycolatopsis sp. NPDC047767]